jgi:hypothetical protein
MVVEKYNNMGPITNANNVRGNLKLNSMQVTNYGRESFNSQAQAYCINANNMITIDNPTSYTFELSN